MNKFGWDLPPGVTTADIDRAVGADEPDGCVLCGADVGDDEMDEETFLRFCKQGGVCDACQGKMITEHTALCFECGRVHHVTEVEGNLCVECRMELEQEEAAMAEAEKAFEASQAKGELGW